jgi:2-oxo-3-hexenedioate decarboxylase
MTAATRTDAMARRMFDALTSARQIAPSGADDAPGLADAYAVTAALRALRTASGERPVGRKIGFTNRTIWAEYNVFAPIWGDMFSTTVHDIADLPGGFSLAGLMEPRIEPEIVFGLGAAPRPGMDDAATMACIGWVAQGFEIVQSPFPGWRFAAADSVIGGGLHGALLIGPRKILDAAEAEDWRARLATFEVELARDGTPVDRGHATNVLDGPLLALRHLVELLAHDPHNPPLAAGEIVTTGTLTRAFPVASGERWTTRLAGLPLPDLGLTLA